MMMPAGFESDWRNAGLRVLSLFSDHGYQHLPTIIRRQAYKHWRLHCLVSGQVAVLTAGTMVKLVAPAAVLMRPDASYQISLAPNMRSLWLITADFEVFTLPGWRDPLHQLMSPAVATFPDSQHLLEWARQVPQNFDHEARLFYRPLVDHLLALFLHYGFSNAQLALEPSIMPHWLADCKRALSEPRYLRDPQLNLSSMAQLAGVNRSQLCHAFRRHLDLSPLQWLRRERITNACRELRNDQQRQIGQVARRWGYHSQALFCRHFHQLIGCSPSRWRRQAIGSVST